MSVLDLYGDSAGNWVKMTPPTSEVIIECLDGVWWQKAPAPRWWHRCRAQTRALYTSGVDGRRMYIERCACGAIRMGVDGRWLERNTRLTKDASGPHGDPE